MVEKFGIEITANTVAFNSALQQVEARTKVATQAFNLMGAALAGISFAKVASDFVQVSRSMQSMEARLTFLTGSTQAAGAAMNYIREVAKRQNVDILAVGDAYARMQTFVNSGKLSLDEMRKLLEGMNDLSKVHRLDTAQLGNVYYGLSQTLSQATIQMQELNQVVEPVPGLLDNIAKAAGVTSGQFREMVADARVTGADFKRYLIKALEDTAGASEKMSDTLDSSFTHAQNAHNDLLDALGDAGGTSTLSKLLNGIAEAAESAAYQINALAGNFNNLTKSQLIQQLDDVVKKTGEASKTIGDLQSGKSTLAWKDGFGLVFREDELKSQQVVLGRLKDKHKELMDQLAKLDIVAKKTKETIDEKGKSDEKGTKGTEKHTKATKEAAKAEEEFRRVLMDVQKAAEQADREAAEKAAEAAERARAEFERPFIQAAENIQNAFADTFADILTDGIASFSDLGNAIKRIMAQAVAQSVTAQLFSGFGSAGGGSGGGIGFNPLSMASSALGQTAVGAGINSFGASLAPSLFSTGAPIGAAVGPTQLGSLSALGMTPATIGLAVAGIVLPKIIGGMKPRAHPASRFGGSLDGSGFSGDLTVASKHMGEEFGSGLAGQVEQMVTSLQGLGVGGIAGRRLFGGVDDGTGFLSVGAGIEGSPKAIFRFDPQNAEQTDAAIRDLTVWLAKAGQITNDDLNKALQNLQTEGKTAAQVLDELAQAAAMPELRSQYNNQLATEYVQTVNPQLASVLEEVRKHGERMKEVQRLGADTALAERLHLEKMAQLQAQVDQSSQDSLKNLQEQVDQAGRLADRYSRITSSLQKTIDDLMIGALSPMTPRQRYLEAQRQFSSVSSRARLGDADAAEALPEAARKFLEVSRDFNAGSGAYTSDFEKVTAELDAAKNVAERQVSIQAAIQNAAERQITELQGIRDAIKSSNAASDLLSNIKATGGNIQQALARQVGYTGAFGGGGFNSFINDPRNASARAQYIALGRTAGIPNLPAFAAGGIMPSGRVSLVGERGAELVASGDGGRVYSAEETTRMLSMSSGGGDVSKQIARLSSAVAALAKAQEQTNTYLRGSAAMASRDNYARRSA